VQPRTAKLLTRLHPAQESPDPVHLFVVCRAELMEAGNKFPDVRRLRGPLLDLIKKTYPIPRRSQKANLLLQSLTWFFSSLELWSASSIRRQHVPEWWLLWPLDMQAHRHGLDWMAAVPFDP